MVKKKPTNKDDNLVAQNRKARHDYRVLQTYEAGIALTGTEIKSVRASRVNLKDGFAQIRDGQATLMNRSEERRVGQEWRSWRSSAP